MQDTDNTEGRPGLTLVAPSLPKGGGALTGMSGSISPVGPDGSATLSIPLPVTPGRGYAPELALQYSSQAGNGPFGIGWSVNMPAIRRHLRRGVPRYDGSDSFLGPDGAVWVPFTDVQGQPESTTRDTLLGTALATDYRVSTWRSRVESDFSQLEYWQPVDGGSDFWVHYQPDGQVHLLGYDPVSRLCDPDDATRTACWLLCASVSATGEQIVYHWRAEDEAHCDTAERQTHPRATAQRYLGEVHYGNITPGRTFPCLTEKEGQYADGLFVLVFDYGERLTATTAPPAFSASGDWLCRPDCFSGYEYGFEVRTRRRCHQVLMYHRLGVLSSPVDGDDTPVLVSRLLLTYTEDPCVSTLQSVCQQAWGSDGVLTSLPPLVFDWQRFIPPETVNWQVVDLGNLNPYQPWQAVDLWGEGIAGVLYQDAGAWWYRSAVRATEAPDGDSVVLDVAAPLPQIPALQGGATLADLRGDGRLQWVVTQAGVNGHYEQDATIPGRWLRFTPLSALPVEYAASRARLTDLTGGGFTDLALIGPRSVRLYAGQGNSWAVGQTVLQAAPLILPVPDADPKTLVAFSDLLGSGQQHLVQIRADGVTCWPSLGHGRFGQPLSLPGFSQPAEGFNPEQVFLADIDGSGTVDIVYALTNRLAIYRNHSGNRFSAPLYISLPPGVQYDHTCQIQVSDLLGLGTGSLLLTVPNPYPRHYILNLTQEKPWLLKSLNNRMGLHQTLHYRSSVQFWLDEKALALSQGKSAGLSRLPFPIHTLCKTVTQDEITGNRLVSEVRYRHGVWDGLVREFCGFGYTEVRDLETVAGEGDEMEVLPSLTCRWYATGNPDVDNGLPSAFWSGDVNAYPHFQHRFTVGSGDDERPCAADHLSESVVRWLQRAMKGHLLREEVYGLDGSHQQSVPYRVTEQRLQVRLIDGTPEATVVWPSVVERRQYQYERVVQDPQCNQHVTLASDTYGTPLREVSAAYPRRPPIADNPYPQNLPTTVYDSSHDAQQQWLRLTVTQSNWHHLAVDITGRFTLPNAMRTDVFTFSAASVPEDGLSLETLPLLLSEETVREFTGQQQTFWLDKTGEPSVSAPAFPPRQAFTETAVLTDSKVQSLKFDTQTLLSAGYQQMPYLFAREAERSRQLWSQRTGRTTYGGALQFWRTTAYQEHVLGGMNTQTWDPLACVVLQHCDAAGMTVRAEYDWRFLTPVRLYDENDNEHQVTLDALGRVSHSRFRGTEGGAVAGYSDQAFTAPTNVDDALALTTPLPVAQSHLYVTDSWMKSDDEKVPPHTLTLTTDRYDDDGAQQIRQQVVFSDGLGRQLQTGVRSTAGEAWVWSQGALADKGDGTPLTQETTFRWCISGRTEYDSKGQPVRVYQPYFLNSWKYVKDDSLRQEAYADTHFYDPLGREYQVLTAKGYCRRTLLTPWFVVSEDENDTQCV